MSVELGGKAGIARALEGRSRCGCSLCARQMRCTELGEMPIVLAIARPLQWVASCGGSVHVSATTRAVVSAAIGAFPGLRVLSRSRPSSPFSAKRCCHRHTVGRLRRCCGPPSAPSVDPQRQNDARSLHMLARPVAVGHDRRQMLALRSVKTTNIPCAIARSPEQWSSIAYPNALLNPLIVCCSRRLPG